MHVKQIQNLRHRSSWIYHNHVFDTPVLITRKKNPQSQYAHYTQQPIICFDCTAQWRARAEASHEEGQQRT